MGERSIMVRATIVVVLLLALAECAEAPKQEVLSKVVDEVR